jgi:hypothetical protein
LSEGRGAEPAHFFSDLAGLNQRRERYVSWHPGDRYNRRRGTIDVEDGDLSFIPSCERERVMKGIA